MSLAFGSRHSCDQGGDAARGSPCAARDRPWVLIASVLGSSLAFIESSIVNLALPALQLDLDLGSIELQWIVNGYLLMLGSLLMIGGAAGDRIGLKSVYVVGLALFGGASLACALSPDFAWLVTWRLMQGIGAALLVPTSLALISVHFDEATRPRAIGIWAGASALTTALGPVLGGALVDLAGWRAVFIFIVPLTVIAIGVAMWRLPRAAAHAEGAIDWLGALLLASALSLLTFALVSTEASLQAAGLVALSLVAALAFVARERAAEAPMMPLTLFRDSAFSGANAMTLVLYFALAGALYFVPFNLIQVQGYSALGAGAAFLPMTLLLGFGSAFAGDQLERFSARRMLTSGSALAGMGFALLALPGAETDYVRDWLPGIVVVGIGMTLCVAPLTTVVMAAVDAERSGVASGINNTAARFAGVLAIALLTSVAVTLFGGDLASNLADVAVSDDVRQSLLDDRRKLAELVVPEGTANAEAVQAAIAVSYVATFRVLMLVCAAFAGVAALVAWTTLARFDSVADAG